MDDIRKLHIIDKQYLDALMVVGHFGLATYFETLVYFTQSETGVFSTIEDKSESIYDSIIKLESLMNTSEIDINIVEYIWNVIGKAIFKIVDSGNYAKLQEARNNFKRAKTYSS